MKGINFIGLAIILVAMLFTFVHADWKVACPVGKREVCEITQDCIDVCGEDFPGHCLHRLYQKPICVEY
ncbi:hypothetical protein GE061_014917 [Apolygus lucorum]|uniref:Kazal-like domain-containing protein n=1 Tax=Apolygus lucorum TaxID=248454 RepID=A0A8S9XJH8_APOLU|nr:hypothetical protein GE061_014917 [Apolygus lucorum]